ncbi:RNA polymerase-associated protein rtf1 [Coemansia sp. RSA 1813]|nr:RNA polymerase-associated protein rtf1 [Coemansia sp. RSA 1646]KAJ1765275.1 RNA polymerase-associated protein rtf1 [Coemansia sp. RSA 1843]KAJ2090026.1 RNA polymerase-associated protein rtf1 [Coemansia sp. RSA 986]KAJ2217014.1 RNA polymerase-associated protein rtf1 [Coemansia sp. RSA 487]KAJ2568101.1 RNA polymerase-associated protein rtf1 [Coemansia sp. RSA 1813]
MDNLENDILELFEDDAGAGRSSERSRGDSHSRGSHGSKRRKHGGYNGSPHNRRTRRDDYSGTDEDEDVDMDTGDDIDIVEAEGYQDDDGPLDQWGEDLMGDHSDRKWLGSLNEVERERILAERQERRDVLNEQRELRRKLKSGIRVTPANDESRSSKLRRANRDTTSRGAGAFSDLKRARERRTRGTTGRWSPYSGSEEESDEEEGESEPVASLDEINSICISRNQIEQWLFKPFFTSTVVGCFVRIVTRNKDSSGEYNQYKMMEVVEVVQGHGREQPPYHLNKTLTDTYLTLRYGALEKDYSMETISNSPIKNDEFGNWESTLRADRVRVRPSVGAVKTKLQDIESAKNYQLSETEVSNIIAERNRLRRIETGTVTGNPALERAQLYQLRIDAQQSGNWEELKRIEARLATLDKITGTPSKGDGRASQTAASGHKPLLAPSSVRTGNADSKGSMTPRRPRLLTPSSSRRTVSAAVGSKNTGSGFALVPDLKTKELSLRAKVTPGYVEMMAKNGGYDMSFLKL